MISLKHGFSKRIICTKLLPFNLMVFIIFLAGCNPSLRFAEVKYDAAQINRLLDSTKMDYLTFQNNARDAGNYKKPFDLLSYARTNDGGFIDTVAYELMPLKGSTPKTFKGKTTLGNLTLSRKELIDLLTDPKTGMRYKSFSYLRFTPVRDADYGYLYFDVKPVPPRPSADTSGITTTVVLRPCPPATWCRVTKVQ